MRKPYSDETRNDIVEKYLLGESVREIHDSTGVSIGSISEYINDFSSKIEKQIIDAMHDFFKMIRKNGMQPKDAFYGHVVFSILLKYNLDPKQINSFVESVLYMARQKKLSAEHLTGICKTVSEVQSNSDVPLEKIESHCTELIKNKNELEASIDKLSEQYKQSQNTLSVLLKKNNLTEQRVEKITNTLKFLENIGFDLTDADSAYNMLQNAKSQGYDVSKICSRIGKDESLDFTLHEKQSKLDEVEKRIGKLEKKNEDMSIRHENLVLRHKSMAESIASIDNLGNSGVSEKDLVAWQKIFESFELTPKDFLEQVEKVGNAKKLFRKLESANSKLKKENESLEKKKSWLKDNVDNLSSEISNCTEYGKNNLKKITDHVEFQIDNTMIHTKKSLDNFMKFNQSQLNTSQKQFMDYFLDLTAKLEDLLKHSHKAEHSLAKMESLKPLHDLVNGKFDPISNIPQVVIILDKLYVGIKNTSLDKHVLSSDIKRIREHLLDLITHA